MTTARVSTGIMPLLPLRSMTLFPGVTLPVDLGRPASVEAARFAHGLPSRNPEANLVVVATQRDPMVDVPRFDDLHEVAVVGQLTQVLHGLPGRLTVFVRGLYRVNLLDLEDARGFTAAHFSEFVEEMGDSTLAYALAGALQDLVKQHDELLPSESRGKQRQAALATLVSERNPGFVADMATAHVELPQSLRYTLLRERLITERLRKCIEAISEKINILQVRRDLDDQVREHMSKHEHEAFLRHKKRAIESELGRDDDEDGDQALADLRERLDACDLPRDARQAADRELGRLGRMNPQSAEAGVARTYLEWLADLPWGDDMRSPEKLDLDDARQRLESGHYGLEKVKKRVIEYLCVRKLAPNKRGPILCLYGPPGTGKTSLAQSIATALGRELVRISLGGVRDDAEIRGHRRTYVGAIPGRFIQSMKQAGTTNPVIVLDEIDKLTNNEMRGDPASALLEALDPEQNDSFEDHYLGVPYDLSSVIFICTANYLAQIPTVLRDRLEIIEMTGYTIEEKLEIARQHLLPKLRADHGLDKKRLEIDDATLEALATGYTRESGVRDLQRQLAGIMRDVAMKIAEGHIDLSDSPIVVGRDDLAEILGPPRYFDDVSEKEPQPGVVTGLGWTPTGGRLLFVEVIPTGGTGQLRLTGRLGEIMKESGQAALSLVRSRAAHFGLDPKFMDDRDLHIHLPAGAVPKDGPSAGIALTTALVSALTGRPARPDVAMTGEVTLRGQVLPVGGVREKVLAAHRAGIREVILPERNRKDENDIPPAARNDMTLHFVSDIDQVLDVVLLDVPDTAAAE